MTTLVVEGGHRLIGSLGVEGNKNAALPLLAACLLTNEPCELSNVPRIKDVGVMVGLLRRLGAEITGDTGDTSHTLKITCDVVTTDEPDARLVGRLRGSVLLVGPLLARLGRVRLAPPGGDFPARRTIEAHLQALRAMGVVDEADDAHHLVAPEGLKPASIYLEEASVTGTETALLAAAAANGRSELRHAACEPHVVELCEFLQTMGVEITGAGTPTIQVSGGMRLRGASRRLRGDYIEAGSWAVAAAVTGGELEVRGVEAADLEPILSVLTRMCLDCSADGDRLSVRASSAKGIRQITTAPWPGFPSDNGEPGQRARYPGERSNADSRLDVRTSPLCSRTAERYGGGHLSVRPAPHDRQWPATPQRAKPRHTRPAFWDGPHRGGPCG